MNLSLVLLLKWTEMLRKCGFMGIVRVCSLYIVWRGMIYIYIYIYIGDKEIYEFKLL